MMFAGGRWTIKLGTITVSVKQGDITRESTDAIVNSSNAQLQLDRGDITHIIFVFFYLIRPSVL